MEEIQNYTSKGIITQIKLLGDSSTELINFENLCKI